MTKKKSAGTWGRRYRNSGLIEPSSLIPDPTTLLAANNENVTWIERNGIRGQLDTNEPAAVHVNGVAGYEFCFSQKTHCLRDVLWSTMALEWCRLNGIFLNRLALVRGRGLRK